MLDEIVKLVENKKRFFKETKKGIETKIPNNLLFIFFPPLKI